MGGSEMAGSWTSVGSFGVRGAMERSALICKNEEKRKLGSADEELFGHEDILNAL